MKFGAQLSSGLRFACVVFNVKVCIEQIRKYVCIVLCFVMCLTLTINHLYPADNTNIY